MTEAVLPAAPGTSSHDGPSPYVRLLLLALVCLGIVFNNVLRWYPFPPGRSANDMGSLASNLLGILVNLLVYAAILAAVLWSNSSLLLRRRSRALELYCVYLVAQIPFRADPFAEAYRSVAMVVMLLSADWLATVVIGFPGYAERFLRRVWWTTAGTVLVGWIIGLTLPDAVNWGQGRSPSFEVQNRGEFFFFYVLPHYGFALSLAVLADHTRRTRVQLLVALATVVLVATLAELTMTRTIVFSLLLVGAVFLFRYARKTLFVLIAAGIVAAFIWPGAVTNVAERLRVSAFFSDESGVDATTGRLELVMTNLRSFADNPLFGQGAQEARRRAEATGSMARTEHGYSLHPASSGLFSLLLFGYVIRGLIAGIRIVMRPGSAAREVGPYGVAVGALALTSVITGFFWTFSSATSFYDWLAVFFVSAARVTWQVSHQMRQPALPVFADAAV
jgi:O-Antigen ligase